MRTTKVNTDYDRERCREGIGRLAKPIIVVFFACSLFLVMAVSSLAIELSETQTVTFPYSLSNGEHASMDSNFTFNKFDPTLGVLKTVGIRFNSSIQRNQFSDAWIPDYSCFFLLEKMVSFYVENWLVPKAHFVYFKKTEPSNWHNWNVPIPDEFAASGAWWIYGPAIGFSKYCLTSHNQCWHLKSGPNIDSSHTEVITDPSYLSLFQGSGSTGDDIVILFDVEDLWLEAMACRTCKVVGTSAAATDCDSLDADDGNANGNWIASVTLTYVYDPLGASNYQCPYPHAEANGPYSGRAGIPITFSAEGSWVVNGCFTGTDHLWTEIAWYQWDWNNDGVYEDSTTSPTITHVFDTAYSGNVRLIVMTNHNDGATDVATVVVAPPVRGDLDGDCDIDNDDAAIMQNKLGAQEGNPNYSPKADLDGDKRITLNDWRILRSLYTGAGVCGR